MDWPREGPLLTQSGYGGSGRGDSLSRQRTLLPQIISYQPEALARFTAAGFVTRGHFGDCPTDDPLSIFMEKQLRA